MAVAITAAESGAVPEFLSFLLQCVSSAAPTLLHSK
ncbi:unnamed protein product [Calypogeia fissa]